MTDLRATLQTSLGTAYTLERELGGGGMSRVFLAEEQALGRKVVVKVLPSDVTAGVNLERFKREIQVSAKLQHPHIVPVLATGEMNGLPYYTMPFVEGESLRARLIRHGALSITEGVSILRDVARALAYAHDHGVAHRDIKPDNILLSGGSATVADFGIAKAISAARDEPSGTTLTQIGTSLGTPAYMAPEQAAADPATNHRADIYAFGCVAYEVLTGRPPFTAKTPQRLLAAQMGEKPQPLLEQRADCPQTLADLVMKCLEKEADARPQSAADLVRVLETVTSGGGHAALPPILLGGPAMFRRALAYYATAFVAVLVIAQASVIAIGLPDWVVPGATLVMLMGLPVILFTAYVQRVTRRAMTMTPTYTPGGTPSMPQGTMATIAMKASPHMTWRRATMGGVYAVGVFVMLVAGFMALRALGIGPAASLFAAGKLARDERLLVTDFGVKGGADSSLGTVISEAIRTDLAQSAVLSIAPASLVRASLTRMRRPLESRLDATLASEIAMREGIKAIVDGDVTPIGSGFIISARLIAPETGDQLWSSRETAEGPTDVIPAVERLSRSMRRKIGESLKDVRATPDLADVTTSSLEALRKYAEGVRASDVIRDPPRAVALLKEAIALDTSFAMAWRKLAVAYNIGGFGRALTDSASARALQFRDRLPEVERLSVVGLYYGWGPGRDRAKAAEAFEKLSAISPSGYHNLAVQYGSRRQYARAETLYRKTIERVPIQQAYDALIAAVAHQGRLTEAESLARAKSSVFAGSPGTEDVMLPFLYLRGRVDSAELILRNLRNSPDAQVRAAAAFDQSTLALVHGKLAASERAMREGLAIQRSRGVPTPPLADSLSVLWYDVWLRERNTSGVQRLDALLQRAPIRSLPVEQRPYFFAAELYASAGRPDRARGVLSQYENEIRDTTLRRSQIPSMQRAQAEIALAEGRAIDALQLFRKSDTLPDGPRGACAACVYAPIARAFDRAGMTDSAIVAFERFLTLPGNPLAPEMHPTYLAGTYKRLGELYEQKGNASKALEYYGKFVTLWRDADPDLQPKVAEVRRRMARLAEPERR
jgi:tetratricopeptide (TPR) repeat protein/tRNA A-37 threonylcarbamoyl transferase component Bud32/TolB-like protein